MQSCKRVYGDLLPLSITLTMCLLRRRVHLSREVADDVVRARCYVTRSKNILGRDEEMCFLDNNTPHGRSRGWYVNGARWWEAPYVDGKKHGITRVWHNNGVLRWKITYVNGRHLLAGECGENGVLLWETTYANW